MCFSWPHLIVWVEAEWDLIKVEVFQKNNEGREGEVADGMQENASSDGQGF